jgi:Ankyrin repeats (3 copies)
MPHDGVWDMWRAARDGRDDELKRLVVGGGDVENRDWTAPLMAAAANGHSACVDTILGSGARVDTTTSRGNTALHLAAINNHPDVVKLLLASGADRTMRTNDGRTALHFAREQGHAAVITLLEQPTAPSVASTAAANDDVTSSMSRVSVERATDEKGRAVRGRRPAIDLNLLTALSVMRNARRPKAASSHVQAQVAKARSMFTPVTTPALEPELTKPRDLELTKPEMTSLLEPETTQATRHSRLEARLLALLEPSLHEFALDRIDKAQSSRAEPDSYPIPAECMLMTALIRRSSRSASEWRVPRPRPSRGCGCASSRRPIKRTVRRSRRV